MKHRHILIPQVRERLCTRSDTILLQFRWPRGQRRTRSRMGEEGLGKRRQNIPNKSPNDSAPADAVKGTGLTSRRIMCRGNCGEMRVAITENKASCPPSKTEFSGWQGRFPIVFGLRPVNIMVVNKVNLAELPCVLA